MLLVIALFVYAGFTAVTEKLDEIIERLTPPRHVHEVSFPSGNEPPWPFGQEPAHRPDWRAMDRAELSAGLYHLLRRLRPGARAALRLAGLIGKCR